MTKSEMKQIDLWSAELQDLGDDDRYWALIRSDGDYSLALYEHLRACIQYHAPCQAGASPQALTANRAIARSAARNEHIYLEHSTEAEDVLKSECEGSYGGESYQTEYHAPSGGGWRVILCHHYASQEEQRT